MNQANTSYRPDIANSQANTLQYVINQSLLNINTLLVCKIVEITGNTYTIKILTNYLVSTGKPLDSPLIYDIPAMQIVGNSAGVIIEYAVGDVVYVGFCQRDISIVKKLWSIANPASLRKFSLSDGIILGYLSNSLPSTYVKITQAGIEIESNNSPITINSGNNDITINAENATINSTKVDINSGNINLGAGGVGILNELTQFEVTGVQAGMSTLPVIIVPGTSSTTVKATS